jgi:hypothetical protein
MSTKEGIAITEGEVPVTPTVTHYQQLADSVMKALDDLSGNIPQLVASHTSTEKFVRTHVNVSVAFLGTAITVVEQTPELQAVKKLDVTVGRDTLQFIEAFRPVLDKFLATAENLRFTMMSRKAALVIEALQVYDLAKGLVRDPSSAALIPLVDNMSRDLGRRGRTPSPAVLVKRAAKAAAAAARATAGKAG